MPTSGPTENIERAILARLFQQYPTVTTLTVNVIRELVAGLDGPDVPACDSVPADHLRLIPQILVGLYDRGHVQLDLSRVAMQHLDEAFSSGRLILDLLRQWLSQGQPVHALITMCGSERLDLLR